MKKKVYRSLCFVALVQYCADAPRYLATMRVLQEGCTRKQWEKFEHTIERARAIKDNDFSLKNIQKHAREAI